MAYTKLIGHKGLYEPIPRKNNICLSRDGLGQLKEDTCGLGQALGRKEDGVLEIGWKRAERTPLVQLISRRQGICHMRHDEGFGVVKFGRQVDE